MDWNYDDLLNWNDSCDILPNVIKLNINNKLLTTLPLKIFKLTSLRELYCLNFVVQIIN